VQQCTQAEVLLLRGLVLDVACAQLIELVTQARVLALRVHEPAEVAVDVAERARDSLGADLEWAQHRRTRDLRSVQRSRRRLPERDRDQDE
jgi:hypothetical protein